MPIKNEDHISINSFKAIEIESLTFIQNNRNRILREAEVITERKIRRFEFRRALQQDESQREILLQSEIDQVKTFLEEPYISHLLFTLEHIDEMDVTEAKDISEDQFQSAYEKALIIEYGVDFNELDMALEGIKNSTISGLRRTLEMLYLQLFVHKKYYEYLVQQSSSNLFASFVSSEEELYLPHLESENFMNENSSIDEDESGVQWKGNNKTEFVQHIYALFEAGLISNDSREVTKIVEQMAKILRFDIGKNWQSNHSKSINNRNNDYEPEIFDRLKKSYAAYTEQLIQGTRNRKKS